MRRVLFFLLVFLSFSLTAFAAPSICGEALSDTYLVVLDTPASSHSVEVTAPANCTYSISTDQAWIAITSGTTATGNSTVSFNVGTNNQLYFGRVGVVIIGGKTLTINQGAGDHGAEARRPALDLNGDRVSDFAAIENSGGQMVWWTYHYHITTGPSTAAFSFGLFNEDIPVPNDYDGDRKTDVAVWRGGPGPNTQSWFYVFSSQSSTVLYIPWGMSGDDPAITQDFDGDARADYAVTRKIAGKLHWFIKLSATNSIWFQQFGDDTDKPVRGDYDGDYHSDLAVYRPNTGMPANTFLYLRSSDDALGAKTFGLSDIDKVVPGDYDGNGYTDFAVWRTTSGDWYWASNPGNVFNAFHWGQPGDLPVPADYNDSLSTDYAVWRPGNPGIFYVHYTTGSPFVQTLPWGNSSFKIPGNSMQVR
jgi:Viral BACON domain